MALDRFWAARVLSKMLAFWLGGTVTSGRVEVGGGGGGAWEQPDSRPAVRNPQPIKRASRIVKILPFAFFAGGDAIMAHRREIEIR